jgi:DNA repair protein RadD
MTTLRPYQREAVDAVHAYWQSGGGDCLVELATGTGKSVVLAELCRDAVTLYGASVLVLTHVKELVKQDLDATLRLWPQCPAGINSAGLGRRDRRAKVLFASIQSVGREDGYSLGPRQLIIIDEAHLVPRSGDGFYRTLLARLREIEPNMRVVGLTATPFRLDSGRLDQGKDRLFQDVVTTYGIGEGVRDGYLAPLTSRNGGAGQIDASGVAKAGGEFKPGALEAAANVTALVDAAAADIVERGRNRHGWIAFASGVDHCTAVCAAIAAHGVRAESITAETPKGDRDRIIREFKARNIRCLVSVGVLTTGFDAPHVDLIAMLRPTLSTGLYVQMLGRGTRPVYPAGFDVNAATADERVAAIAGSSKPNCLVLDYSGNVRRHGPVDAIEVKAGKSASGEPVEKVKEETVRAKECPMCSELVALRSMECVACGHIWEAPTKHEAKADHEAHVMVREVEAEWFDVTEIKASVHTSAQSGNLSLRVDYWIAYKSYSEWVMLDADQWLGEKARRWWQIMTSEEAVPSVGRAVRQLNDGESVIDVTAIRIRKDGKYWRVSERLTGNGSIVDEKLRVTRPRRAA